MKGKLITWLVALFISVIIAYVYSNLYIPVNNMNKIDLLFISVYLFVVCFVAYAYLLSKTLLNIKKDKLKLFIIKISLCLIVSIFLFGAIPAHWITPFQNSNIVLSPVKSNPQSGGNEIWLNEIIIDGQRMMNKELDINEGWVLKDDALFFSGEQESIQEISIQFKDNIILIFGQHAWSGSVKVDSGEQVHVLDLYTKNSNTLEYDIKRLEDSNNTLFDILVIVVFFLIASNLLYLLLSRIEKNIKKDGGSF
ncbi:hypothetical protein [Paenibacillus sp. USHLN196]|uniref:hypothetical protein n=1 Tax=Paenibacillus sp. USHLN196 TaxID=3081291 RepID=UPI003015DE18